MLLVHFLGWKIWHKTPNLQFSLQTASNNHVFASQKEQLGFVSAQFILKPFLNDAPSFSILLHFRCAHSCLLPSEQMVLLASLWVCFPLQFHVYCDGFIASQ